MYDQREKAQRDYEWGLTEARNEGLRLGVEQGKLAGKIQTLQELLGDSVSTDSQLISLEPSVLTKMLVDLQTRIRDREA